MFKQLEKITKRPMPFEYYTTPLLWNDEHISKQMLEMHLNPDVEAASRNHDFIEKSVKWICGNFNISSQSAICDFGCGPGLYTNRFGKTGSKVTGIDLSTRSIEYAANSAKTEKLDVEYLNQNYLDFTPNQKYDLITMIYCDFCVLSPEQRNNLLSIFRKSLKPNGKILLDVFSKSWFTKQKESLTIEEADDGGFWSSEKYFSIKKTMKYEGENLYLDKYAIIQQSHQKEIYNWLKCYNQDELIQLFSEKGFTIDNFYENVAGDNFNEDSDTIAISAKLKN